MLGGLGKSSNARGLGVSLGVAAGSVGSAALFDGRVVGAVVALHAAKGGEVGFDPLDGPAVLEAERDVDALLLAAGERP